MQLNDMFTYRFTLVPTSILTILQLFSSNWQTGPITSRRTRSLMLDCNGVYFGSLVFSVAMYRLLM